MNSALCGCSISMHILLHQRRGQNNTMVQRERERACMEGLINMCANSIHSLLCFSQIHVISNSYGLQGYIDRVVLVNSQGNCFSGPVLIYNIHTTFKQHACMYTYVYVAQGKGAQCAMDAIETYFCNSTAWGEGAIEYHSEPITIHVCEMCPVNILHLHI